MANPEERTVYICTNVADWKTKKEENSDKLVVVHFSAKWCSPCKLLEETKTLDKLAKANNTNVLFLDVDVDKLREVADEYKVEAMPTFVFIKNGKELGRVVGAMKKQLRDVLKMYRESSSPAVVA